MNDAVEDLNTQLSDLLILGREQKKMSIEEVAKKLNLSPKQLEKFEDANLNLQDLSPFERGYLRNYAALLEVDIKPFEAAFPSGINVSSELQSIQRDGFKTNKPIMNQGWVKITLFILITGFIVWLLFSLGINFTQMDFNKTIEQATEMTLPNPKQ